MANFIYVREFLEYIHSYNRKDRQIQPLIRHQNPQMNPKGVKAAPKLPPRPLPFAPGTATFAAPRAVPEPSQQNEVEEKHIVIAKKRDNDAKFPPTRIPQPSSGKVNANTTKKYHADADNEAKRPAAQRDSLEEPADKKVKTTDQRTEKKEIKPEPKEPSHPLPSIPHQRMHRLRRIGAGGEGYCDLFQLHHPPQTLLAVKTLKKTPQLILHQSNKHKPLEAYVLQDILRPHPRILRLYGYTHNSITTRMYYEYCPLNTLQEVVENHCKRDLKIPEAFIWHAFQQLAEALAYIHLGKSSHPDSPSISEEEHFAPILHRDIKPEN
ncbi:MAG: hypothetical protein Q9218_007570, partial [Villophora microphyllina]